MLERWEKVGMMPQVRWWFQHARCDVFKLDMEEETKWRDCKAPTESLAFTWEKTCKASRFKEYSRTRWICVGCCRPWNRNVSFRIFETSFEMLECSSGSQPTNMTMSRSSVGWSILSNRNAPKAERRLLKETLSRQRPLSCCNTACHVVFRLC